MSSQNDTIVDTSQLTHDDLLDSYDKLAAAYRKTKNDNEEILQTSHKSKKQLEVYENSLSDLQTELDQINLVHRRELAQKDKKVEEFKEKNNVLLAEKQQLEMKLDEISSNGQETIDSLRSEVEGLRKLLTEKTIKPRISDTYSKSLELENDTLRNRCNELEVQWSEMKEKFNECMQSLDQYKEKITCLEENVESKKADLDQKNEVIEHLQEKINELSSDLKNSSVEVVDGNRKGNSLFAEVDDQRQKMKSMLKGERQHYLDMKKSLNGKEIEIRRLKRENLNIKSEIQSCSTLFNRGDSLATQNLNLYVARLEMENKNLENRLKEMEGCLKDLAGQQKLDWIDTLISTASKECRELKDKNFVLLREKTSAVDNCTKVMKDLSKAKLDAVKYKTLLGRIVDEFKVKIRVEKYQDIGVSEEFLENLIYEEVEEGDHSTEMEIKEEEIEDATMSRNLNESTIFLLGGREKLGSALPNFEMTSQATLEEIVKENIKEEKVEVKPPSPKILFSFNETPVLKEKSVQFTNEAPINAAYKVTPEQSNESLKPAKVTEISLPPKSPKKPTEESSRLDRKRAQFTVRRFVIPSKVPKKDTL